MSTPFIFITTHQVEPRHFDEFLRLVDDYTCFVKASEPDLLAHHTYLNREESQVTLVQIHPDPHSMDNHLQLVGSWIARGAEISKTVRVEVYGQPGPAATQALRNNAGDGAVVHHAAPTKDGFNRFVLVEA